MSTRKRLLVLTHNYPRNEGDFSGVFLSVLCRNLVSQGIDPIILAPHDKGIPEYEESGGITIYRFRYGSDDSETFAYRGNMHTQAMAIPFGPLKMYRFLKSFENAALAIIEKEKIDAIAGHWLVPAGFVMKTLAKKTDLPMILSSHGTDIRLLKKYSSGLQWYLRPLFERLTTWTFVSSYMRDIAAELIPGMRDKLKVLPLPHDEGLFKPIPEITREPNLIVAITRFTGQKRVELLIECMVAVTAQHPEAKLHIYASGPLENKIRKQIDNLNLNKIITIFAPVPQVELPAIYNRASVVVLNSFEEGFGLALSEAMLCATPVIGTASGGITDIIEDKKTGLLVPVDDPTALSNAILKILTEPERATTLAKAGYIIALGRLASKALAEKYAALIRL